MKERTWSEIERFVDGEIAVIVEASKQKHGSHSARMYSIRVGTIKDNFVRSFIPIRKDSSIGDVHPKLEKDYADVISGLVRKAQELIERLMTKSYENEIERRILRETLSLGNDTRPNIRKTGKTQRKREKKRLNTNVGNKP